MVKYFCINAQKYRREFFMKRFLYIFVFVFALAILMCFSAFAANTTYTDEDGIVWNATVDETTKKATITDVTIEKRTDKFVVPSVITYNEVDYPVTAIGNNAFSGKTLAFGKLTLPDTLESIGSNAFSKTNIYSDVVLPESLKTLGTGAFAECKGILTVKLPSNMKTIPNSAFNKCYSLTSIYSNGAIEEFGENCFNTCYALHSINIGVGTKKIASNAFLNCRGLDGTIDLSTVTSLASNAFQNSFNITGVKLSAIKFELSTFSGCSKIASYEVVPENNYYSSKDGVLYNKSMSVLYRYPIEKTDMEFTIPDSVVEIYTDAFSGAYHIGRINLSKSITKIGSNAFKGTGIDYLYIPDSVTSIGSNVLSNCDNLEWVVISKSLSSASNLVLDCDNIELVIGRHPTFSTTSVGNSVVCKRAVDYVCTSHIYGFLDDTASCTESGVNTCIICDRSSYVKPTGHEGPIVEKSELNCTTDSYIIVDCTKCGDSRAKTVFEKAPGHVSVPKTVKPTDTTPGFTVETCSVCNETVISNYVASFYLVGDINNDGAINNTDAICLANYIGGKVFAVNELSCDINGDEVINLYDLILLRRFIAKIDSEINKSSNGCKKHLHISSLVASECSCIDDGIEIFYCLDCGTIIDTKTTEKSGHTWEIYSNIKATCANSGFSSVKCTVCGTSTVLNYEKLPHTQKWWTLPGKKGYEYSECEICGAFENRIVDYSEFDTLVAQIPKHYELYYSASSLSLVSPILENYKLALTQEQVDKNVADFKAIMPRIQYAVNDVPVIYINSIGNIKLQDCYQNYTPTLDAEIIVAYYDENGNYHNYIEANGEAKVRGNSTANPSKKPYNIKFSTNIDLFGMGEDNKYCLLANAFEASLMRNALVREFNETCGLDYACKYEFVDVYTDGEYRGNYLLCTPIDVEETRVNIDKKTDAILEIEASFAEGDFYINSGSSPFFNMRFQIADGNELSGEGYSKVFSTIYQIEYAIISGDWEEIQKYADVDSLVRYYILVDYFKDVDFNWDSTRFYIEDGKLHGGPAWDYDRAAGHANLGRNNYYNKPDFTNGIYGDSTTGEWANSSFIGYPNENWQYTLSSSDWNTTPDGSSHKNYTWLTYLYYLSPEFTEMISQYMIDLKDEMTLMYADTTDNLGNVTTNAIDVIYKNDDIYASFARDVLKWGVPMKGDELPKSFNSHKEAVDHLRNWLADRHQWMINHYSGEKLAEYCAELADKMLLDPNENAYAKHTTTSFSAEDGNYTYTVNVVISSDGLIGYLEEALYQQTKEIFADNLSYTNVVINLVKNDKVMSSYSDENVLNDTYALVRKELAKLSNNKYADGTSVVFSVVDGVLKAEVNVRASSIGDSKEHQNTITELVKKHFSNANFYVSVDVKYYVGNSSSANYSYTNGIAR